MWLIVGLGNPEEKYHKTRHNIGFRALDFLTPEFTENKKVLGETAKLFVDETPILLLKPTTYMNLSGNAVQAALSYFKIPIDQLIVIYDDIDYTFGTVRIAQNGSGGGHNGLTHIIETIHTETFLRIRVGIQSREHPQKAEHFVLKNFSQEEENNIPDILQIIQQTIQLILTKGVTEAMNVMHRE